MIPSFRLALLSVALLVQTSMIFGSPEAAAQNSKPDTSAEPGVHLPLSSKSDLNPFEIYRQEHVSFSEGDGTGTQAMRVEVPEGEHYGMAMDYTLEEGLEEVHMRWKVYLPDAWTTANGHHMKFPGIAHTDRHGWGGRRSDGTGGWSVRVAFKDHHTSPDSITAEYYVYHMDMGQWGSLYPWNGTLKRGEWIDIENYVRVNTPGEADGVIRAWVDGELVFEKEDLRFRAEGYEQYDVRDIMWHIYHGGAPSSPVDQHLYLRDLEIWY